MTPRRAFAKLIRARQEVWKRLDALRLPTAPPGLRGGQPRIFVPERGRIGLPLAERSALLTEAGEVRRGVWRTFGSVGQLLTTPVSWTAGGNGETAPLKHWSQVSYLCGPGGSDIKEVWELNRHRGLLRLAQAWWLDGDDAWADSLAGHLDSWFLQNPAGHGINWTSSLEVGFRALAWTWIRALTAGAPIWSTERDRRFAESLWHHGRHLARYDSVHHSPNTHLTGEGLALATLGRAWPHWPEADRWRELGDTILREELDFQVLPDGLHAELAPGYHRYTLESYLLWIVSRRVAGESVSAEVVTTAARMVDALVILRRPDGRLPGIGDEDGGITLPLAAAHPRDPGPVLGLAAGLLGPDAFSEPLPSPGHALAWWLLPDVEWDAFLRSDASVPWPRGARLRSLPSAGYHVIREADDAGWWCLVDAGPQSTGLAGHSHCDLGHVEIQWDGTPIVSDPGSLAYGPDQRRRDLDRAPESHATLTVGGVLLARPSGPFRWSRLAPSPQVSTHADSDHATVALAYEWSAPDDSVLRHERQVCVLDQAGVVVVDRLTGAAGRTVTLSWPIAALREDLTAGDGEVTLPCDVRLHWLAWGVTSLTVRGEAHEFADTYRVPAPGTFLRIEGQADTEMGFVTWFTAPGQSPQIRLDGTMVLIERAGLPVVELRGGSV